MSTDLIGYVYSVVIIVGGVMGFVTKGSLMSGVMGVGSGLLAGFAAYRSSQDPRQWGLSMLVACLLFFLMSARFIQSGKIFPAGVVASLSFLMIIKCLYVALSQDKSPRATS
eukprot:TRINITY_DN1531_c0_g1_i1.p1 TRINITY_DN1531_c0_g1~~TRINITY_DN1531_c0_g1_i1.p1  ORF type:complete len:112 (-),score=8.95 TRINITY_DN1531_c0_g1_i1:451-786(-)